MTVSASDAEKINSMIRFAMLNAVIASPRFSDYRVQDILNVEQGDVSLGSSDDGGGGGSLLGGGADGSSSISQITSTFRSANPTALLGRAAALTGVGVPLALIAFAEPIKQQIIDDLQRPGGILDKRVKIDATKEAAAEIDRQTRQNTRIGDRNVRIQQFEGFRNFEGHASTNTSRMIRENANRVLDIGLFDRAQGVNQ